MDNYTIGIDQSYTSTGIALLRGESILCLKTIQPIGSLKKQKGTLRGRYRQQILTALNAILVQIPRHKLKSTKCICEAIRTHTKGTLSVSNHLSWGGLLCTISDYLWQYNIPTYVVDTRVWKKAIVGTTKAAIKAPHKVDPNKWPTIKYLLGNKIVGVKELTKELSPRVRVYTWEYNGIKYTYNTDVADAICIALYGAKHDNIKLMEY